MPENKRRIICDDTSSDDDFQSPKSKSKKLAKSSRLDSKEDEMRKAVPKKRAPRPSKRKIPTFEEGEACEELEQKPAPSPKRRKSIFASDLIDSDMGSSRGKIQLTFEESLKKCAEKNKSNAATKTTKTLRDFFSKSKVGDQSKKEVKKGVKVDDFFSSSSFHKTPTRKEAVSLVPETPQSFQDDDDGIRLSPSVDKKSLDPVSIWKSNLAATKIDNLASTGSPKTPSPQKSKLSGIKSDDECKTPSKKVSSANRKDKTRSHKPNGSQPSDDLKSPSKKIPHDSVAPSTPAHSKHIPEEQSATTPKRTQGGGRASFWQFQNRDGPQALGSRHIPQGASMCFNGKSFVITGVLECIERDDVQSLIERGGGRVTKAVSKKTTYLVVGRDPGNSKIDKATSLGTKQITENEFFELVDKGFGSSNVKKEDFPSLASSITISKERLMSSPSKISLDKEKIKKTKSPVMLTDKPVLPISQSTSNQEPSKPSLLTLGIQELWVEKYRPKFRKQLVGQNGPSSPANRLFNWLSSWQEDYTTGRKEKGYQSAPPWASGNSSDTGSWARAALLSGPPGIGKTSTASVVCTEVGLATIELNASDTRSKRSLKDEVSQALGMRSLAGCLTGSDARASALTSHVLIMDEVDGMAGNEDRGGMQELIGIIKTSKVPIICLCNDRQSPKVRSLANYCLDLRFHRPRIEQIKSAVLSIACREGVNIHTSTLNEIIAASNQDMRQVINSVQLWCMTGGSVTPPDSDITANAAVVHKDLHLSPFEVIRKVFAVNNEENKPMRFNESLDLFFQDYSIGPLFVQENYLNVRPLAANGKIQQTLDLMAVAASDIAQGDIVNRMIQSSGAWSLLPTQAVFSCLRPGRLLRGPLPGGPGGVLFPSWLGKASTQGKNARLLGELSQHMRLSTHGGATDPRSLLLDYLHPLAIRLSAPLKEGDVDNVLKCLDNYQLLREDMDNIMDLTTWQGRPGLMKTIDAKVKSALTRSYNKGSHLVPYATELIGEGKKKGRKKTEVFVDGEESEANQLLGDGSEESSAEDEAEIQKLAKVKPIGKPSSTDNGSTSKSSKAPKKARAAGGGRKKKET
nr:replication factor c subunit 1 [Hymenolepis microstoma]